MLGTNFLVTLRRELRGENGGDDLRGLPVHFIEKAAPRTVELWATVVACAHTTVEDPRAPGGVLETVELLLSDPRLKLSITSVKHSWDCLWQGKPCLGTVRFE